jgi:serine/threonine protein phosphatase PrpC
MSSITTTTTYSECAIIESGTGQDYAVNGTGWDEETAKQFEWSVVCDGHGTNHFIEIVRKTNFAPLMAKNNPIEHIIEYFAKFNGTYRKQYHNNASGEWNRTNCRLSSGSTIIIAKIYIDKIEGAIIGDSRCAVYIDGEQRYISTPHNTDNPLEVQRLFSNSSTLTKKDFDKDPVPIIIAANKLKPSKSVYTIFPDGTRLATTQALGHDCYTGFMPEMFSIIYSPGQRVRYIAASDGFWDMHLCLEDIAPKDIFTQMVYDVAQIDAIQDRADILNMTAPELAQKAVARWSQEWEYHWQSKTNIEINRCSFPAGNCDDVGVYVWDNGMPEAAKKVSSEKLFEHSEYVAGILNGKILSRSL